MSDRLCRGLVSLFVSQNGQKSGAFSSVLALLLAVAASPCVGLWSTPEDLQRNGGLNENNQEEMKLLWHREAFFWSVCILRDVCLVRIPAGDFLRRCSSAAMLRVGLTE